MLYWIDVVFQQEEDGTQPGRYAIDQGWIPLRTVTFIFSFHDR
jgi:hypothetical protein